MRAEVVSVGTELLLGQITDTHAPNMARLLAECGIACERRATIGDNRPRLVGALREALERADILVTIGGLGPTEDDLTRDAIAEALGEELVPVPEVEERLKSFFSSRGIPWVESNARQATRPESAELIDNPNGTAPGLHCRKDGKTVLALPGPRGEFNPMAEGPVRKILEGLGGGVTIHSRTLRVAGIGESLVEERIRDLGHGENPTVAPYAHTGEVHLRLTARAQGRAAAEALLDPVEAAIRERLGDAVYGVDDSPIEAAVLDALNAANASVGVAESMTGGGLAQRFTNVPGASIKGFRGGVVVYTPDAKCAFLGLDREMIDEHGPVSEPVAAALAKAVKEKLDATFGVAIVGNAGPEADVDGKPVGLVYVGLSTPEGETVDQSQFRGTREDIRRRGEQTAFTLLLREIRTLPDDDASKDESQP